MFTLKKRNKPWIANPHLTDKLAGQIAGLILKIQMSLSTCMNKLFNKMSYKSIRLLLIFACFITCGYSTLLIFKGTIMADNHIDRFGIGHPIPSINTRNQQDTIIESNKYINEEIYRRIQLFKNYLDSLKKYKSNQYDSIINLRPLLMDSVLKLEEMYLSQNQK